MIEVKTLTDSQGKAFYPQTDQSAVNVGNTNLKEKLIDVDNQISSKANSTDLNSKLNKTDFENGTSVPKGGYIRTIAEAKGAVYNENSGYYELNGLTDITEQQMKNIVGFGDITNLSDLHNIGSSIIRTNINNRKSLAYFIPISMNRAFASLYNIEVISLNKGDDYFGLYINANDAFAAFFQCNKLKKIIGVIDVKNINKKEKIDIIFEGCYQLISFQLKSLSVDINIKDSAKLGKDSLQYMVNNSANSNIITITLHPTIFAKVTNSQAEWGDIYDLAQTKQIVFAQV